MRPIRPKPLIPTFVSLMVSLVCYRELKRSVSGQWVHVGKNEARSCVDKTYKDLVCW